MVNRKGVKFTSNRVVFQTIDQRDFDAAGLGMHFGWHIDGQYESRLLSLEAPVADFEPAPLELWCDVTTEHQLMRLVWSVHEGEIA